MRAAIVGMGWWGQTLVNSAHGKGVDFVLGQTRTRAKAEDYAKGKGIRLVDSFDDVLKSSEIEAVVLATPHSAHGEQVRAAVAAGKHVFVEKPFTLTAKDAEDTVAAVKKSGKILAVGFNRRFHPNMIELKSRVKSGALGDVGAVIGSQTAYSAPALPAGGWRSNPEEAPAGALTAIGVHTLDCMISIFGEIAEVHCVTTRRAGSHVDDTTMILLRFKNGVSGTIFCSIHTAPSYRFTVWGTKAVAEIANPDLGEFKVTHAPSAPRQPAPPPEVIQKPGFDMLQAELVAFAEAVRAGTPHPVLIDEVVHGVKAFEAIVRSAKEGKPVAVK